MEGESEGLTQHVEREHGTRQKHTALKEIGKCQSLQTHSTFMQALALHINELKCSQAVVRPTQSKEEKLVE